VRLFVAADLPAEVRVRLGEIQDRLRPAAPSVRWVRPEGIHLTLKFLGEVAAVRRPGLEAALAGPAMGGTPFHLEASGVGLFPERGAPRIVWVGIRGEVETAAALRRAIDGATQPLGFEPEGREFRPHLTLGRVRGSGGGDWRAALERASIAEAGRFEVREFVLFESRLGPEGAAYTPLARFPLRAGEAA
jgi:2'-5' RNA ligase